MTKNSDRQYWATAFYELLLLANKGFVFLEQREPAGNIEISIAKKQTD